MNMNISTLVGITLVEIVRSETELRFKTREGRTFVMSHIQDYCESVYIEDIAGDLQDLLDFPILKAEEVSNPPLPTTPNGADESFTWTFYHLATIKGYVTIRWFGTSNGYYSESVDFYEITGGVA